MPFVGELFMIHPQLAQVATLRPWSAGLLEHITQLIEQGGDEQLFRLNPLALAAEWGFSESELLDFFLLATQQGVFVLEWSLFCASCGCVVQYLNSLTTVHAHYRCEVCAGETNANLDDFICAFFHISPAVRPIIYHNPSQLTPEQYYFGYKYTRHSFFLGGVIDDVPEQTLTRTYFQQRTKVLGYLRPGESHTFTLTSVPDFVAVDESATNSQTLFFIAPEPSPIKQTFTITIGEPPPPPQAIPAGELTFVIHNPTSRPAHIFIPNLPQTLFVLRDAGVQLPQTLSANRLLAHQTFRELFRQELIAQDEGLGIRQLTFLFSDLKGSTDLYDRMGDLSAFTLVREHFEFFTKAIRQHNGALVKTIGDAVMAVFTRPVQAVLCAEQILQEIARFNVRTGRADLLLKIGIHTGPCIAITLNERLDYFGQTVNISARVQGLAEAEEICLTQAVCDNAEVQKLYTGRVKPAEKAKLKGVAEAITLYRLA